MSSTTVHCKFAPETKKSIEASLELEPPCRAARMLALAHHIELLIDAGELADYAAAARVLGLTRARVTQVMNLLLLAPAIQQPVVLGDLNLTERRLRDVVGESLWEDQLALA